MTSLPHGVSAGEILWFLWGLGSDDDSPPFWWPVFEGKIPFCRPFAAQKERLTSVYFPMENPVSLQENKEKQPFSFENDCF